VRQAITTTCTTRMAAWRAAQGRQVLQTLVEVLTRPQRCGGSAFALSGLILQLLLYRNSVMRCGCQHTQLPQVMHTAVPASSCVKIHKVLNLLGGQHAVHHMARQCMQVWYEARWLRPHGTVHGASACCQPKSAEV
jgi:hypothetical protein